MSYAELHREYVKKGKRGKPIPKEQKTRERPRVIFIERFIEKIEKKETLPNKLIQSLKDLSLRMADESYYNEIKPVVESPRCHYLDRKKLETIYERRLSSLQKSKNVSFAETKQVLRKNKSPIKSQPFEKKISKIPRIKKLHTQCTINKAS